MRLLIDDDSTCSKDRACAQQPDKTNETALDWADEIWDAITGEQREEAFPLIKA